MEPLAEHAPSTWDRVRLGQVFNERKTKVSDKDYPPLSVTMQGIVPQLDTAAKTDDGDNRKLVLAGDYVINSRSDRKGSGGISDRDGSVSLISIVLEPDGISPDFAHHLLRSVVFQEEFYRWGSGIVSDLWSTRYADMKNIRLAVPPTAEQRIIAAYLDRETGRIDALVERLERLIALLTEKRQAVISHAVTKGLNPDALMKDSGIDWLGEVPAHWELKPLKYLVRVSGGGTPSKDNPDFWNGHIPWVTPKDMKRPRIDSTTDYVTDAATAQTSLRMIESEGVMIVVRGMILARTFPVAVNMVPVTINQDMKHLASAKISSDFLSRYLSASEHFILSLLDESGHGTKALRSEQFFATICLVPPSDEQSEITAFCEIEEARFDALMQKAQTEINTLKERRSALISAAVTGQIPIAEMAPNTTPEDAA